MTDINTTTAVSASLHNRGGKGQTNPNSLANLRPFRPGESGNPKGRPSGGLQVQGWLNELLIEDDTGTPRYSMADIRGFASAADDDAGVSPAKRLAASLIVQASEGDKTALRAIEVLFDRTLGKPPQSIDIHAAQQPSVQFNAPSPADFIDSDERGALPDGERESGEGGDNAG